MRIAILLIALLMATATPLWGVDQSIGQSGTTAAAKDSSDLRDHRYLGYLRLYVVEPTSRYLDYYGDPYSFGFLGFALNQPITLNFSDTLSDAITWSGTSLSESNIMVIAVLFSGKDNQGYSDPDEPDCPFVAHYVDATASATPGHDGVDTASGAYTHTVFVEEVTSPG